MVVFAVANRQEIHLDLWPLPFGIDIPAYLAVLGPLALGLVGGALPVWLSSAAVRLRANRLARQLNASRTTPPPS